jgi:hypothetical protein
MRFHGENSSLALLREVRLTKKHAFSRATDSTPRDGQVIGIFTVKMPA